MAAIGGILRRLLIPPDPIWTQVEGAIRDGKTQINRHIDKSRAVVKKAYKTLLADVIIKSSI